MLKQLESRLRILLPFWIILSMGVCINLQSACVTVITHGLEGSIDDWVKAMAMRIPDYPGHLGTNASIYGMFLRPQNGLSGPLTASIQKITESDPLKNVSGEIIVALDWSIVAKGSHDTFEVAAATMPYFFDRNFVSDLGGHALAELPFHLIGHSRGGSLVCELSRLLGTQGVWVDHLTTLDPHPLNNDGFFDVIYFVVDAPALTYENVLFHDNYFQFLNIVTYGEAVAGAYQRELKFLDGGYGGIFASHSDVHLWYHGTIDFNLPATDTVEWITEAERQTWWTPEEKFGVFAGFYYSKMGEGNRSSTNNPAGLSGSRVSDGYNKRWNFGVAGADNRVDLKSNSFEWPNIITMNLAGTNVMIQGQSNAITAFIQHSQLSVSPPNLSIFLDRDFNPWNGNELFLKEIALTQNPAFQIGSGSIPFELNESNSSPGFFSIFGKITGGGQTRYLYAPEILTIQSSLEPPKLSLVKTALGSELQVIGISGRCLILQHSGNLQDWNPIATNCLPEQIWRVPLVQGTDDQSFYRALLK